MNRIIHLSKMTGAAGSEGHLLVLLEGLRRRTIDAELWILVEPDNPIQDYIDRAERCGIPTRRIPIHRDIDPGLWWRLTADFRKLRPDLVHTHLFHADLYGTLAARAARVPYVVSSRHNDDKFRSKLPMRLLHRGLWHMTDAGIAISEAIRQFSIDVEGVSPEHIQTIHYGLDPDTVIAPPGARSELCEQFDLPADALIVGSVCRLIEQKGLLDAIHGFAQIAQDIPDAYYVIAGDGPQRHTLEVEVMSLGLQDRIYFLGWRNDAHAILAALDVLLAPSLWEGFGLVFLEAMALGVPIISTQVSAIPEVIQDGKTGWLVPPRDAPAVAEALREALEYPRLLRERGEAGRLRLEQEFSPDTMVERTLALYRRLEKQN